MRVLLSILSTVLLLLPSFAAPGDLKWSFAAEGAIRSSPALAPNGWIIFGSYDGNIYAVDTAGNARWKTPVNGQAISSAAVSETTVYIGVMDGLVALDALTGEKLWHFHPLTTEWRTTNAVLSTPTILPNGSLAFADESGVIHCVDGGTADPLWSTNLLHGREFTRTYASPLASSQGVLVSAGSTRPFYGDDAAGVLAGVDSNSGQVLWHFAGTNAFQGSAALGADGTIYLGGFDKAVHALDPLTGAYKWARLTGDSISASPVIGPDGTLYVGSHDGYLYALDSGTGDRKWRFLTGDSIHSSAAIAADGTVYFGSYDKDVYALDGSSGAKKWSFTTGGKVLSSPLIGPDGTVYIGSFDGNLYALEGSSPQAETGWPTFKGNAQRTGARN